MPDGIALVRFEVLSFLVSFNFQVSRLPSRFSSNFDHWFTGLEAGDTTLSKVSFLSVLGTADLQVCKCLKMNKKKDIEIAKDFLQTWRSALPFMPPQESLGNSRPEAVKKLSNRVFPVRRSHSKRRPMPFSVGATL